MDEQMQDNQLKPMYNSSVPIQDVALKTYRERWTIETAGERGSERSLLDNQQEPVYNSSVPIQDVALKIYRERWTIETVGERGSERSLLSAWYDDDDWLQIVLYYLDKYK